jgi:tricarballylate dehydrogenase
MPTRLPDIAEIVVVGAGNAAMCAALAAAERGGSPIVLEAAPEGERGGNSAYTAGAMRFAYDGVEQYSEVVDTLTEADRANIDFGTYTEDQFFDDLARVTESRCDPDLAEMLIRRSRETLVWMRTRGITFQPSLGRQAFKVDGRFKFWGGVSCEVTGGGPGLIDLLNKAAERASIPVFYETRMIGLEMDNNGVCGVQVQQGERRTTIRTRAIVLACGGFESNAEMRTRYLGPGWDMAKVRGTRFNMGDGIRSALAVGAMSAGHWSGCHAVGWELNAPPYGDLAVGDQFQKHSYPFGIMVNAHGERFLDEGADFRNYTYAKYGAEILKQPGMFAWQIYDAKVAYLLRDEYRIRQVTKVMANTIEELAAKLDGVDQVCFLRTVQNFNAAVRQDVPFNPNVKDGRAAAGLAVPKSNWANTIEEPPFQAYAVTCGVTFTFGGLKVNTSAMVENYYGAPIPGLFAAGELVGGLFYFNYPGGSGLTAGSVFGRAAGYSAAEHVASGRGTARAAAM